MGPALARVQLHPEVVVKKVDLLKMASGLAATGLIAYRLATVPIAGMDASPISAGTTAGFPWTMSTAAAAPDMIATSDEAREAALLQKAFAAESMSVLGIRVIDLTARGADTRVNVQLSAEAVDSTVLRPNDQFSFNQIVGVRTIERGYQAGMMYANGQVVSGVGGGICVTSTAIYNVALETGMTILERHPHSGAVTYADPGRDSAVVYGSLDLRFINNTGSVVLIRSFIDDDRLVVAFYGKKQPGRQVLIATEDLEPIPFETEEREDASVPDGETRVEQKGHPGHCVTTVRIIKQNGKVVSREMISRDVVRPRKEIVLVHSRNSAEPGSDHSPGIIPMPMYTSQYDMPQVQLSLPEPTLPGSEDVLPAPDAGMRDGEQTETDP